MADKQTNNTPVNTPSALSKFDLSYEYNASWQDARKHTMARAQK